MLLAVETSCDETALALFDIKRFLAGETKREKLLVSELVSSQVKLHEPYGGVVPELAAREHLGNLPLLIKQLLQQAGRTIDDLTVIAVTRGPGLNGCLLVGLAFAKALAYARNLPLLALNHLEGHLFAPELEELLRPVTLPAVSLLVSGGHTELIFTEQFRKYKVIARTRDDAVGEAFDKSATLLGLPYPGGPALAECAEKGRKAQFRFPVGMPEDDAAFSFSGVKTAVSREVASLGQRMENEQTRADMANAVQEALVKALIKKTTHAVKIYSPRTLVLSGGVAANTALRIELQDLARKKGLEFRVPEKRWCTDNAAMLAVAAARIIEHDPGRYTEWRPDSSLGLGPDCTMETGAMPRWPIERVEG